MKTAQEIEALEQMILQLGGLHSEISQLSKKSPNDALNKFKMQFVNKVLQSSNQILQSYKPFSDFDQFDLDDLPTNSDVTLILAQYIAQAERFRSDNVGLSNGRWFYKLKGEVSERPARSPTRVGSEG